ncbi:hypothetical protein SFBM_1251 [Candidatus Arthromitus sp. SFB-mouse-Japan]|uniref:DUF4214 domain-containing protein n=1 Tax=unclassified Candidatus Neoarthromitus TaxID=2638829 RepID=UPI00021B820C|nr:MULTISPECIES: DUF4214 domain-containing protein [unclassified Candidatus Arthromitus]AID45222.1 Hypothetical protein SFBmNL_01318 [Candidatus Arthromitus sp. SFB-mouse-NL]BAK57012.1 hypothetical protein SFBM_1251 [Candidatus Arthromitus sp. SFB-mouse-Japan]
MKSFKLRKLVAGIAMLAMTLSVLPTNVRANAAAITDGRFENNWTLNSGNYINSFVNGSGQVKLSSDAKKTEESVFSIEKLETKVLTSNTTVASNNSEKIYKADENEGGVVRFGIRLSGELERTLRRAIDDAVSEHRGNVNTVNANRHNNGVAINTNKQLQLAEKLLQAFDVAGYRNSDVRFLITYTLNDGRVRTTTARLSDLSLDMPATSGISSSSDLRSLVDDSGLIYVTLRGLPTNVTITNVEIDSRDKLTVATNAGIKTVNGQDQLEATAYSVQNSISYNAGTAVIPTATWTLTDALFAKVGSYDQYIPLSTGRNNVIDNGEHMFVKATGSTITLIDIFRDTNKTITGATVVDRRGDSYSAQVGDFEIGKITYSNGTSDTVDHDKRYRDLKIGGLNSNTTYDFEYIDVHYTIDGDQRTQRIRFDDRKAANYVTGNKYLSVSTSNYQASQVLGFDRLVKGDLLYQANVGLNKLTYLVKVDDVTNLERLEVRGLRADETYTIKNVKSEDGKKEKSNWFAVEISNLDTNRTYDFLSIETVYNENGRERYGNPISLGRNNSISGDSLFPYSSTNIDGNVNYNYFAKTNKDYKSELWIDSELKYEQIPGGVKFYGRIKDADDIINGVNVYVNNGGNYEKIDDSKVKLETNYRVVKGLDVNGNGSVSGVYNFSYPLLESRDNTVIQGSESKIESASEMVEITITGIEAGKSKDFRFEFSTTENGNRVSSIRTGEVGSFGSIPASGTKTQQSITRYATGRAGTTKVEVSTSNVSVTGVTTSTAVVNASIKNTDKEMISVEVSGTGVNGIKATYNVEKNVIELSDLKSNTEYTDLKLTLKYGDKSTTLSVPTFKTSTQSQSETGIAGYVTRVYRAFFNREPDKEGLMYWVNKLATKEETLKGFLGQLSFTPELLEKNLTNTKFVEAMYAIVDRAGETEGVTFWTAEIEKGIQSGETQSQARASVVSRMLDTDEVRSMADKLGIKFE